MDGNMTLNAKNLGLSGGILWGAVLFIITLISVPTGYASGFLSGIASIYPGYSITYLGSIVALIYGFIDGFIALFIIALIYNKLEK
jgi:hypothetical protein